MRGPSLLLLALAAMSLTLPCADASDEANGPRPGKYKIFSYGATNKPPLYLGCFVLGGDGSYEAFLPGDKPLGKGRYEFDGKKSEVSWKSGPYEKEWEGKFTSERDGKTHKIRLKRTTIATNNTDDKS